MTLGCLILVWFAGSIGVAYWMGEPYLRGFGGHEDPVEVRMMAEALGDRDGRTAPSANVADESGQARIDQLERQIADAVMQIDAIRSDAVAAAFDRHAGEEVSRIREAISTARRELEGLQQELTRNRERSAGGDSVAAMASADDSVDSMDSQMMTMAIDRLSEEATSTRRWAVGAIGVLLVSNLLLLGLLVRLRQRPAAGIESGATPAEVATVSDAATVDPVAPGSDEDVRTDEASRVASTPPVDQVRTKHASAIQESPESDATRRMIEEMRRASIAGADAPREREEFDPPPLILVHDDSSQCRDVAREVDVVAENRLGVDFAVRITNEERADLALGSRRGDSSRSVA